jgi:hypothetical protein
MGISTPASPAITGLSANGSGPNYQSNYWYAVRANYPSGSPYFLSKAPSQPAFASDLANGPTNTYVNNIFWTTVSGATNYDVYRCWGGLGGITYNSYSDAVAGGYYGKIATVTGNTTTDTGQHFDGSLSWNHNWLVTVTGIITTNSRITVNDTTGFIANFTIIGNTAPGSFTMLVTNIVNSTTIDVVPDQTGATITTGQAVVGPSFIMGPPSQVTSLGVFSDTSTTNDSIGKEDFTSVSDSETLVDNTISKMPEKPLSDSQTITDNNLTRMPNKGLFDLISLSEALHFLNLFFLSDVQSSTDSIAIAANFHKSVSDSQEIIDNGITSVNIDQHLPDNIVLNDWISIKLFKQNQWGGN